MVVGAGESLDLKLQLSGLNSKWKTIDETHVAQNFVQINVVSKKTLLSFSCLDLKHIQLCAIALKLDVQR